MDSNEQSLYNNIFEVIFWIIDAGFRGYFRGRSSKYHVSFSYQSLQFFGGLHNADITEILSMDMRMVCRDDIQAKMRFRT